MIETNNNINLRKYFDRIVCINLDKRTDRWEESQQEFAKWGIEGVERVSAIDGRNLPSHPRQISAGAYGLILTTLSIIKQAKEDGLNNILLLEDDVYFRDHVRDIDAYMAAVPSSWQLLYLGGHHIQQPQRISEKILKIVQVFTTHSFAIDSSLFDRIIAELNDFENFPYQVDLYFSELQKRCNAFAFFPNMTSQRNSHSDIEEKWADYNDNMDENLVFEQKQPKYLSIAIPCYDMHGRGAEFLRQSLHKIHMQSFQDYNVVISDHSEGTAVQEVADMYKGMGLDITYIRKSYETDNPSSNMNNAIRHCNGVYIKMLFQDDFLYDNFALENTVRALRQNPDCKWLVSASEHSEDGETFIREFQPRWNDDFLKGNNTISSPSVVTIKNVNEKIFFDLELIWLMDCDYYYRCHERFGLPVFLNQVTVVNRLSPQQLTNTLTDQEKSREFIYIDKKYAR